MNCYAGLAKRLIKSCFPRSPQLHVEVQVQIEPLANNKACFALGDAHERLFKPVMNEYEAWVAAVAWVEAKAQERETEQQVSSVSSEHTDICGDSDSSIFGTHLGEESKCPSYASVMAERQER